MPPRRGGTGNIVSRNGMRRSPGVGGSAMRKGGHQYHAMPRSTFRTPYALTDHLRSPRRRNYAIETLKGYSEYLRALVIQTRWNRRVAKTETRHEIWDNEWVQGVPRVCCTLLLSTQAQLTPHSGWSQGSDDSPVTGEVLRPGYPGRSQDSIHDGLREVRRLRSLSNQIAAFAKKRDEMVHGDYEGFGRTVLHACEGSSSSFKSTEQ